jgi:hypothetical protein
MLTRPSGAGRRIAGVRPGWRSSRRRSRSWLARAATSPFQAPIACSSGASARLSRIAAGKLAAQHQPGAEAEDPDLDEQPQKLGNADEDRAAVARQGMVQERAVVVPMPSLQQGWQHAHGVHDLGVAHRRLATSLGDHPEIARLLQRRPHHQLVAEREREQEEGAYERERAEPGVQQPDHGDEHERPRHIEDRKDAFAADEAAQLGEITERLAAGRAPHERFAHAGREYRPAKRAIEPGADAHQRLATDHFEDPENQQREGGGCGERQERLDVAARQHTIEDLEHIERRNQHQQVQEQAESADHSQAPPRFAKRGLEGGRLNVLPHGASRFAVLVVWMQRRCAERCPLATLQRRLARRQDKRS